MKKQLRFLYRYYILMGRWRRLFNRQALLVALATLAFLVTLGWTAPSIASREKPQRPAGAVMAASVSRAEIAFQATSKPAEKAAAQPTPTRTPFPPEFYENADQTMGITLFGAALVLIVVVGAMLVRPKRG